jgi:hypothetical protein
MTLHPIPYEWKRLLEFEVSQGKGVEVTVNNKEETLTFKTFVWISPKNLASALQNCVTQINNFIFFLLSLL